jgi:hypothetical protein
MSFSRVPFSFSPAACRLRWRTIGTASAGVSTGVMGATGGRPMARSTRRKTASPSWKRTPRSMTATRGRLSPGRGPTYCGYARRFIRRDGVGPVRAATAAVPSTFDEFGAVVAAGLTRRGARRTDPAVAPAAAAGCGVTSHSGGPCRDKARASCRASTTG